MPTDRHQAEYNAQARIITRLNDEINSLRDRLSVAETYKSTHDFYMLIQNACKNSPVVAEEFRRFLAVCKLVEEDETPGLTTEDNYNQMTLGW